MVCALGASTAALATTGDVKADDDEGCRSLDGHFSSVTVPPPACTSPVGLCTHGLLAGDFPATYDFTFSTLQSTKDPTDPTAFVYTGHSVVTTPAGAMHTDDSGVIHIAADGSPAPFVTTASVASGTGRYAGETGVFVATGKLNFATGLAVGSFVANLCGKHPGA